MKRLIAVLLACLPAQALAQDYAFRGFDAPLGATASLNLRVPLGSAQQSQRPSYGMSLGYGRIAGAPGVDGRLTSRAFRLADLRLAGGEVDRAQLLAFDLTGRRPETRLGLRSGPPNLFPIVGGAVVVAVGACAIAGCFD